MATKDVECNKPSAKQALKHASTEMGLCPHTLVSSYIHMTCKNQRVVKSCCHQHAASTAVPAHQLWRWQFIHDFRMLLHVLPYGCRPVCQVSVI